MLCCALLLGCTTYTIADVREMREREKRRKRRKQLLDRVSYSVHGTSMDRRGFRSPC